MKNKFIRLAAIFLILILLLANVSFASEGFEIKYDINSRAISLSGVCGEEFVQIAVIPTDYIGMEESLAEEQLNGGNVILRSIKTSAGTFNEMIELGDGFPIGCYIVWAECEGKCYKRVFANSDISAVSQVSGEFSSSADSRLLITENITALGFDSSLFNLYGDKITDQINACYKLYNISAKNFTDMYLLSEGIVLMQKGVISAEEMIDRYSGILTPEIMEKYSDLEDSVKTKFQSVLPKQNFKEYEFEEIFESALLLARVNALGQKAKTYILDFFAAAGTDIKKYNALSSYYKDRVMGEITGKRDYVYVSELTDAFNNEVETQKANMNKSGSQNGGNSSSSSVGGGGFAVANTTNLKPVGKKFEDIENHWAKNDIYTLTSSGAIDGYEDGNFRPDDKIKRCEFAKILSGMLGLSSSGVSYFEDVTMNMWFAPYVYAAAENGLIIGVTDALFAPDNNITREDAAVILHRLLSKNGVEFYVADLFEDDSEISEYAADAVRKLTSANIIRGDEGRFNPKNSLTRAETAAMLCRISAYLK